MKKLLVVLVLCLLSAGIAPAGWAAKQKTYFAIGDSYAFGYTTDDPSDPNAVTQPLPNGAPGYVTAYARTLDPRRNSLEVVNLAIPGETSANFVSGGSPGAPLSIYYHPFLYPAPLPPVFNPPFYFTNFISQKELLLERIKQAKVQRRDIYRVTIHLGGNDLQLLLGDPGFVFGSEETRREKEAAVLAAVELRYRALLTALRQEAPKARLILIGYLNPFRGLDTLPPIDPNNPDPNDPRRLLPIPAGQKYEDVTKTAIQRMNTLISNLATEFDATYVDIYDHFTKHNREGEWTYILHPSGSGGPVLGVRLPNVHPSAAGYAEIADLLAKQEERLKD